MKTSMNWGISEELKTAFPNIIAVHRPVSMENVVIPDPSPPPTGGLGSPPPEISMSFLVDRKLYALFIWKAWVELNSRAKTIGTLKVTTAQLRYLTAYVSRGGIRFIRWKAKTESS